MTQVFDPDLLPLPENPASPDLMPLPEPLPDLLPPNPMLVPDLYPEPAPNYDPDLFPHRG